MKKLLVTLITLICSFNPILSWGQLVITEVFYDSPLEESMKDIKKLDLEGIHHNGEFIEIYNNSTEPVDLSGYSLRNLKVAAYETFVFPQGTSCQPKDFVIVAFRHPNSPEFGLKEIFKNLSAKDERKIFYHHCFILSNNGNTVILRNRNFEIVSSMTYKLFDAHNGHRKTLSVHRVPTMANVYLSDEFGKITQTEANPFELCKSGSYFPLQEAILASQPNVSDKSKMVCEIKMDALTTPTGAANVEIPLNFPPGISDFAPKMSVVLNSQGGMGALGIHAELTGLSSISRTQESDYFDGKNCPVKFQEGGPYTLDGTRLIRSKENPDLYETVPVHSFVKIELIGRSGNGPVSFRVTSPDGMVAEYGADETSRVYAKDGVNILTWKLTKVTNPNGLTISYRYMVDPECGNFLENISYRGYLDFDITFTYKPNNYLPSTTYVDGTFFKSGPLLSSIIVNSECTTQSKYRFEYSDARLTKITEYGKNRENISLDIVWGKEGSLSSEFRSVEDKGSHSSLMFGDINGDGVPEIVQRCPDDEYIGIYFRNALGNYEFEPGCKITVNNPNRPSSDGNQNELRGFKVQDLVRIVDIDHDGIDEFIFKKKEYPDRDGNYNHILNICKYENGSFKVIRQSESVIGFTASVFITDFENNGYTDLLVISSDGRYSYGARGDDTKSGKIPVNSLLLKKIVPFDTDGFGKISLLFQENKQWKIYDFKERRILDNIISGELSKLVGANVADMNNDGLSDLVFLNYGPVGKKGFLTVLENKGGTFGDNYTITIDNFETPLDNDLTFGNYSCITGDINGDGLPDLILILEFTDYAGYLKKSGIYILLKSADGSYRLDQQEILDSDTGIDLVDFNNDGYFDILKIKNNQITADLYRGSEKNLFKSIWSNGVQKVVFDYGLSNDKKIHRPIVYNSQIPQRCGLVPTYLVKAMHVPNGLGDMRNSEARMTSKFNYYGGSYLNDGRGMLGFEMIEESYTSCGNENITVTETGFDSNTFLPVSQRVSKFINGELNGISYSRNLIKPMGNVNDSRLFRFAVLPEEQRDTIFTDNSITCTKTQYDDFNRMVKQTVSYDDGSFVTTENRGYSKFWKPLSVVETRKHYQDDVNSVNETQYAYDAHSNLTSQTDFSNTSDPVTTYYTYDSFGRVTGKTKTGKQVETKEERYAYDESGCSYKITTTNPLGTTVSLYDPTNGNLEKESIAYKGISTAQTTTYGYDKMGRKISEMRPDGTQWEKTYSWSDTGIGYYVTTEWETGKPKITKWYDLRGREIYSKVKDGDVDAEHAVVYSPVGQKLCELDGHPKKLSSTNYAYYPDGRIKSVITHTGKDAAYSYNGRTTYVSENGRQFKKRLDSWGNVIEQTDPNGLKISHTYASCGKPKATAVGSHVLTMEYDAKGNQLKLHDPDVGEIRYTYDAYDRIKTYQDPKGGHSFKYDVLGNVLQKSYSSGRLTDYTYNYSGNGIGLLNTVRTNNGTEYSFTYDEFGRVLTKQEKLEDQVFTYANAYDKAGRLSMHTSPDGFTLKYAYDQSDSRLMKVFDPANYLLWERLDDIPGIKGSYRLGNGQVCTTTRSCDESECSILLVNSYDYRIHQTDYTLDPIRGNVVSHTEYMNGSNFTESFAYDEMDRLCAVIKNSVAQTSYDDCGNIISKTDVGEYRYESDRSHAVTGINDPTELLRYKPTQTATYTEFNKVAMIREGNYEMRFVYGPYEERVKSELYRNDILIRTIYYGEGFEKEIDKDGKFRKRTYLDAEGSIFGMFVNGTNIRVKQFFHTDLLGSVIAISNAGGIILENRSYDAWGRRRNPVDWEDYDNVLPINSYSLRGYTFQEEMPEFGLVNLNGRLYDPLLARMLSPDPFIQEPGMTQSYNRYSYCLNNPLKYTDPNGEFWHLIIGAAIGGIINWATHGAEFSWSGLKYFGIGAFSGALGAGLGSGLASGLVPNSVSFGKAFLSSASAMSALKTSFWSGLTFGAVGGASDGFVSGLVSGLTDGKNFRDSFYSGIANGLLGGVTGGVTGGIIGGIEATLDGRRFFSGSRIEDEIIADRKLLFVRQRGKMNCAAATGSSISRGKLTQEQIRGATAKGNPNVDAIFDSEAMSAVAEATGKRVANIRQDVTDLKVVTEYLKDDVDIIYNLKVGDGLPGHVVAINKVVFRTVHKVNGTSIEKMLYYVMDPARGQYIRMSESSLNNYTNRLVIW